MKTKGLLYLIGVMFVLAACKKDKDIPSPDGTVKVGEFSKIDIDGNVILNIHYSESHTGEVKIKSDQYDWKKVEAKSVNGELIIHTEDHVPFSYNIYVDLYVPTLSGIRLENTQQAIIYWDNAIKIGSFDIVTEAKSKLEIYNFNAHSVTSRQEAESRIFLSSAYPVTTPAVYTGNIILSGTNRLIVGGSLIVADSIVVENTIPVKYTVFGNATAYNLIENGNFRGEGKSFIEISQMPVLNLEMKLEGESSANVWAVNTLSGKGEGQSILNYKGFPALNYTTQGSARLVKID